MEKYSIEQKVSGILNAIEEKHGRGFQAKITEAMGFSSSSYINGAIKGTRGFSEDVRRALVEAVNRLMGTNYSYQEFLDIGEYILDGGTLADWKPPHYANVNMQLPSINSSGKAERFEEMVAIPVAEQKLSAGNGNFVQSEEISSEIHFKTEWLIKRCNPENAIIFFTDGNSMSPTIGNGEMVIIDRSQLELADDKVFAVGYGNVVLLKRVRINLQKQVVELLSDNGDKQRYPTQEIPLEDLRVLGKVVWRGGDL